MPEGLRDMRKVDPSLTWVAERWRHSREQAASAGLRAADSRKGGEPAPPRVHLSIEFTGDAEDLHDVGFETLSVRQHPTLGYKIASGSMPVDRLDELERIDHVVKTEGSRPLRPELNSSVPNIGADHLHAAVPPVKGAGVIVGVIDSGFDYRHGSFRKPDGKTRILALWDQAPRSVPPGYGGPPSGGSNVGIEYTQGDIDRALQSETDPDESKRVRLPVMGKHGTHVAGIAAGDGSQPGRCADPGKYVGVAPEADLILVKLSPEADVGVSLRTINAFDFIWSHWTVSGHPVVVNMSLGDNMGPHDGTSLLERELDLDLAVPGRAVVKSAGNEGDGNRHAEGQVAPGGSVDLAFAVCPTHRVSRQLELWYPGAQRLEVIVVAPGWPSPPTSPVVKPGDPPRRPWVVNPGHAADRQTQVFISSEVNDPHNGDNRIRVDMSAPATGSLPGGKWALRLRNPGGAAVAFDCWIERPSGEGDREPPKFIPDERNYRITRHKTITIPGTSHKVITVGAYNSGNFLGIGDGELADFSSFGPTRKDTKSRKERIKPDICAPGNSVTSALPIDPKNPCSDCCLTAYVADRGTSMAAPHVTGVVALIFQKSPNLTADQVKRQLMEAAGRPKGVTGTLPNSEWGAGKLEAPGAVNPPSRAASGGGDDPDQSAGTTSLPTDSSHMGEPSPASKAPPASPGGGVPMALAEIHRSLLEHPGGELWAALVSKHFSEVRALINANRRVAARWHRMEGPRWVRHLASVAVDPGALAESWSVDEPEWKARAEAFMAALERYGSAELRNDIERHRADLQAVDLASLAELVSRLARLAA